MPGFKQKETLVKELREKGLIRRRSELRRRGNSGANRKKRNTSLFSHQGSWRSLWHPAKRDQ